MGKPKVKFDTRLESDPAKIAEIGKRKRFHPHDLNSFSPKSPRQEQFISAYYSQIPMILQSGSAGTGKTTIALYCAFSEVLDQSTPYQKVIAIRPPVASRDIGFLPGTEEEKGQPYEEAFEQVVNNLFKYNESYKHLKALNHLEYRMSNNLRGLTFDDCIMVIDEFQNLEEHELLTILTRAGSNCKIVICGDSKQDDLRGKKGQKSCHEYLRRLFDNMNPSFVTSIEYQIDDCLRNPLVKEILKADSEL